MLFVVFVVTSETMSLEKIVLHAERRLEGDRGGRGLSLDPFKRFLKIESERLRMRHRRGMSGSEIARSRSDLIDLLICRAFQQQAGSVGLQPSELGALSLVALGGYGRRELAPCSDIDILFLHGGEKYARKLKPLFEPLLYLLWDVGLTVGHSVRSVSECISIAKRDLKSCNALAEARLVTGNPRLFARLVHETNRSVFKNRRVGSFCKAMKHELAQRYAKFEDAVCLQEPNVKEGVGGLRDIHTVLWLSRAKFGCKTLDDLRADDLISGSEYAAALRAYEFLLRVRNEAHFLTGRRTDLLTLDLQPKLATHLGFKSKRGLLASEIFMREYYECASDLHRICDAFLVRSLRPRKGKSYWPLSRGSHRIDGVFEAKQGTLNLRKDQTRLSHPLKMLEAFSIAQSESLEIGDPLRQAIREGVLRVDRKFRSSPEAVRLFREILGRRGRVARTLRAMHEVGLLDRFIPEFGRITFLVQHDHYHRYTIDEHTLKAIEAIDQLAETSEPQLAPFKKIFSKLEDSLPLYLAALLHDTGKGNGGGHTVQGGQLAERACRRLGLREDLTESVSFLVQNHLLMSRLSQRRDLTEVHLIRGFSDQVKSLDRLNMLAILTFADIHAVGSGAWNAWKAALLWELYGAARTQIDAGRNGSAPIGQTENGFTSKHYGELTAEFLLTEVEEHLSMMPERYRRATGPEEIAQHLRLIKRLASERAAIDWKHLETDSCAQVTICANDQAGLFARMAGAITAHGLNILSAELNTRKDGIVIDILKIYQDPHVERIQEQRLAALGNALKGAVEGTYDVREAVVRRRTKSINRWKRRHHYVHPSVRIDGDASTSGTVIEVRAEDEPGLAFAIADTLADLDLSITFAKLATEKNYALDVFYVTDLAGRKLDPARMHAVERALLEALESLQPRRETQ